MTEKFGKISKGRIAVYSANHRLMDERLYYTHEGMRKIMEKWMDEFPNGSYVQVQPYVKSDEPKPHKIRLQIIKPPEPEPPARHEPIYNNIPGYSYEEKKNGHGK